MDTVRCVRYGYGGYGTVGAVKTGIHPYLPVLNFQKQCFPLLLKFDSAKQKIQVGKIKSQTRAVIPVVDDRGYPHWAPKGVVISNLFKACGAGKKQNEYRYYWCSAISNHSIYDVFCPW